MFKVNPQRIRALNTQTIHPGPIVYWMNRDQRVRDNWALLHTLEIARREGQQMRVIFCCAPTFLGATQRVCDFMLRGLVETEKLLRVHGIPFIVLVGAPDQVLPQYVREKGVGAVVTDFSPLRLPRAWRETVAQVIPCALFEVDAHNCVPAWVVSPKQEYGAYTLRPKINRLLPEFLDDFPEVSVWAANNLEGCPPVTWKKITSSLALRDTPGPVTWIIPGETAAHAKLQNFIETRLSAYELGRNDPTKNEQSGLSPYLHFGHISAQRIALIIKKLPSTPSAQAFLEELIIRRELADNFCLYNKNYDTVAGFPDWAKKTLEIHKNDPREKLYSLEEFECSATHDELWNAAQLDMVKRGKMPGYLRMYWAKKILEWTKDAETAMRYAIYLNDTYELDGRDPNGYAGIAWSIGGVHDRAWFTRPVFGTVRYMNARGAAKKFKVRNYIEYVRTLV